MSLEKRNLNETLSDLASLSFLSTLMQLLLIQGVTIWGNLLCDNESNRKLEKCRQFLTHMCRQVHHGGNDKRKRKLQSCYFYAHFHVLKATQNTGRDITPTHPRVVNNVPVVAVRGQIKTPDNGGGKWVLHLLRRWSGISASLLSFLIFIDCFLYIIEKELQIQSDSTRTEIHLYVRTYTSHLP